MKIPENKFKRALIENRQQIGLWCTLSSAYAAEVVAGSGFDWLLFDTEHSPSDIEIILRQLQAVSGYDISAVVRPASNDAVLIKRYLDIGVQTLLIPFVQTVEEARSAVAAMRYAPAGIRGVAGMTRATGFGRIEDYGRLAAKEICLLVQIETSQGLDNLDAIATVDGIDGVFIGPADLAASLGFIGEPNHPEVRASVENAVRRVRALERPAGVLTNDPDFAERCIEIGTTFTAVGVDIGILVRGTEELANRFLPRSESSNGLRSYSVG